MNRKKFFLLFFSFLVIVLLTISNWGVSYEKFKVNYLEEVKLANFSIDPEGKKDSTQGFQKAIDSLGPSGGTLSIPTGTYIISQLKLPSYINLTGSGKGTILKMKKNSNKPLLVLKSDSTQMVTISNFTIDGNKANQTSPRARGIEFINTVNAEEMKKNSNVDEHDARHYIENIYVKDTKGDGLYLEGRGESQIKGFQVLRSDENGISSNAQDNWFTDCSTGDSGNEGLFIGERATNTRYLNCKSWFSGRINPNRGDGYSIHSNRVVLTGSEAQDNSKHGFVFGANDIVGSGLLSEANGVQYETGKKRDDGTGYVFYNAINCNIQGVTTDRFSTSSRGSHQSYALQFLGQSKGNLVQITSRNMGKEAIPAEQITEANTLNIISTTVEDTLKTIQSTK